MVYPSVTVVIPTCNQGIFLPDAVESVFVQDYSGTMQVIVMDDGSEDGTDAVVEQLQTRFPTLEYVRHTNIGVCETMNRGLARANGELFLRLDSDDHIPSDYIRQLVTSFADATEEIAYIYCDAYYFGTREGRTTAVPFSRRRLLWHNYIHASALVRTAIMRHVGYLNNNMHYGLEDWDFYLRLLAKGYRGQYCPDTVLFYRQKAAPGRNQMGEMRRQVFANHPTLFSLPVRLESDFHYVLSQWRRRLRGGPTRPQKDNELSRQAQLRLSSPD